MPFLWLMQLEACILNSLAMTCTVAIYLADAPNLPAVFQVRKQHQHRNGEIKH